MNAPTADLELDNVRLRNRCDLLEEEAVRLRQREIRANAAGREEMRDKVIAALSRLTGPAAVDSNSGRDCFLAAIAIVERLHC